MGAPSCMTSTQEGVPVSSYADAPTGRMRNRTNRVREGGTVRAIGQRGSECLESETLYHVMSSRNDMSETQTYRADDVQVHH